MSDSYELKNDYYSHYNNDGYNDVYLHKKYYKPGYGYVDGYSDNGLGDNGYVHLNGYSGGHYGYGHGYNHQEYGVTNTISNFVNSLLGTIPKLATDLFGVYDHKNHYSSYDGHYGYDGYGYGPKPGGAIGGFVNNLLTATLGY